MDNTINVEWEDIAPKVEEKEFMKQKSEQISQQQQQGQQQGASQQQKPYESIGLADMIAEIWNEVGVEKGYDAVNETQKGFLSRHTARLEEKYLKDKMNMMPEIEAGLAHFTVYVPKWLKHRRANMKKTK